MTITEERLAELMALHEAATPGPWREGSAGYRDHIRTVDDDWLSVARLMHDGRDGRQSVLDRNRPYIVAACNAIPGLVAALREASDDQRQCVGRISNQSASIITLHAERDAAIARAEKAERNNAEQTQLFALIATALGLPPDTAPGDIIETCEARAEALERAEAALQVERARVESLARFEAFTKHVAAGRCPKPVQYAEEAVECHNCHTVCSVKDCFCPKCKSRLIHSFG